jgi:4-amino-4-deoxy-L-arabinose transferase-like glycosyltransferase
MSRRIEATLLVLIFTLALLLRVHDLRGAPPGAQHDEVFSANFATQIIDGARPVYWDQNGGVPVFHAYLIAPVFAALGADIIVLRLVSVVCGLLTILFTYLSARRLFGPGPALFCAALLSVTQWHLFESRVGLEPVTLMLMASITAWLFLRSGIAAGMRPPARPMPRAESASAGEAGGTGPARIPSGRDGAAAVRKIGDFPPAETDTQQQPAWWGVPVGLSLGLTMYTYQSAPLVILALAGFAAYLFLRQRARLRSHAQWLAVMSVIALLVSLPLPVHFLTTAGDATSRPEELAADLRAAAQGDLEPLARDAAGVLGMLAFAGDPSWRYNLSGRPVFTLALGLLAYAGIAVALWRWRDPRYAFVLFWIACNVIASAVTRASPSFLRSSAALPFIVMLPGIALGIVWNAVAANARGARKAQSAMGVFVLLAIALLAWEGVSTAQDYFDGWARNDKVRATYRADLAEVAAFLDTQKPAGMVMLSARFPSDLDQGALYLLQRQKQNYQWFNGRRVLVLPTDPTGQGVSYFIPATNESLGDGAALLSTLPAWPGPLDEKGKPFFTLYTLSSAELNRLRAREPQTALHANIGGEVELIGLDPTANARHLHLLLYWRVAHRVPGDRDRSFFAHLVDASGRLWTQEDRSVYPTSSWHDDDIAWQWYDLQLPADAPAGAYWVEVGVYDANAPGQPRLPILDAAGNASGVLPRAGPFDLR